MVQSLVKIAIESISAIKKPGHFITHTHITHDEEIERESAYTLIHRNIRYWMSANGLN